MVSAVSGWLWKVGGLAGLIVVLVIGLPVALLLALVAIALPLALLVSIAAAISSHLLWAQIAWTAVVAVAVLVLLANEFVFTGGRTVLRATALALAVPAVALPMVALLTYDSRRIDRYCRYGSVSAAQLAGCKSHVTVPEIQRLDTEAADYGMYRRDTCGTEAGPFCRRTHSVFR